MATSTPRAVAVKLLASACLIACPAGAQTPSPSPPSAAVAPPASVDKDTDVKPAPDPSPGFRSSTGAAVTLAGYLEAYLGWNFNRPSNGITAYRSFDNRHDTFTLSNAVLDAAWSFERVTGRLALQIGSTGASYYASEPTRPGGAGVSPTDGSVWRYLQQANIGYKVDVGRGLLMEMGLFLSPIGPEGMAIKDQWNWSRSNLFSALPFYHTGLRATYPITDTLSATVAGYNGWNSVVDNNEDKSVSASLTYTVPDSITVQGLYFGGVERGRNGPEGRAFRHLFDAFITVYVTKRLSLMAHGDAGVEANGVGTSSWEGGALYARLKVLSWLYAAVRGDRLHEHVATSATARASRLFFPADDVTSGTATLEVRPQEGLSVRLEYRRDQASGPMYFRGTVPGDGVVTPFVATSRSQDTLTFGATAWF